MTTKAIEAVARAMEPRAFSILDEGYSVRNFLEERAFLNAEKVAKRARKKSAACIEAAIASGALVPASATKPYSSAEFLTSPEALDEYVKEMVASAVADMRERCAKVAEQPGLWPKMYRALDREKIAAAIRQLPTAPAGGDYVVVPRSDLQVVVDIAGRNEAAPEIGRVRAMLHAASRTGGGK